MMANCRGFTVDESLVVSKLGSYKKKSIEAVGAAEEDTSKRTTSGRQSTWIKAQEAEEKGVKRKGLFEAAGG
jgi:hypothetical protein